VFVINSLEESVKVDAAMTSPFYIIIFGQKETVKSGTTDQKSALPVVSCRGHLRRSFVRPHIQSLQPDLGPN
jgi:hypothetical protein